MNSTFRSILRVLLALLILAILISLAGWSQSLSVISQASIFDLAVSLFLFIIATLLLGMGLYEALRASGAEVSIGRVLYAHVAALLISDVTPARSGYVSAAAFLKQSSKVPSSQTLAAILSVQSVSFAFKTIVIVVAIPYLLSRVNLTAALFYSIAIAAGISLVATFSLGLLVWTNRGVHVLKRTYGIPFLGRLTGYIGTVLGEVHSKGARIGGRGLCLIALCSVTSTLVFTIALYPIALSVKILTIPVYEWILLGPLVGSLGFVPITPGGLGIQEATYVIILSLLGVPLGSAVAFSLLARFLYIAPDLAGLPLLVRSGLEYVRR